MTTDAARPARRTRLTPERERELYAAVLELLREVGYDALTMDAVAARTRSSKATLYRQWKGKPELVVAALRDNHPVRAGNVDTGSLAGDLREVARRLCKKADDTALMRGITHAAERNPELGRAMRETLIQPEMDALHRMLDRAVERGELAPDRPAAHFLSEMITGALLTRPMLEDRHADEPYLLAYFDAVVLPALGVEG
jgi:AcrR family transcriptional regulator